MVVTNLRTRIGITTVMILSAVIALIPRDAKVRERGADGLMRDTVLKQVPLKLGLDLQGGMHLGLELDQSKRVSADPVRDIDLALTVLRKRIDDPRLRMAVFAVGDERAVARLLDHVPRGGDDVRP